jgi:DNA-binding MarR family transcriptional regulator
MRQPPRRRYHSPVADDGSTELGDLLVRVARAQRSRWRESLAPWNLSPSHSRALHVVGHREGARLSDLAEALHIAPRSATEVVDGLAERGLVERRPDPADRRAVQVVLTPGGRALLDEVDAARAVALREMFDRLSAPDRAELARLLRALLDES